MQKFYKQLTSDGVVTDKYPNSDAIIKFWSMLWGDTALHNHDAAWIKSIESNLHNLCAQEALVITSRGPGLCLYALNLGEDNSIFLG